MNSRLDAIERSQEEIKAGLQMLLRSTYLHTILAPNEGPRQQPAAQVHRRNWLPGMSLRMIISKAAMEKDCNVYDWFFKWGLRLPLSWGRVLTGRMRVLGSWPSRPMLCLRQQNIIPYDSVIIEACKTNDISTIQKLFATGQARPNDTTPENLTLLRVGSLSVVKIPLATSY
jgi:hypothetical protein